MLVERWWAYGREDDVTDVAELEARRAAAKSSMLRTPFVEHLGLTFELYEPDSVRMRLPFADGLTNDGVYYHGGVVASVLDTAGAAAVWSGHNFLFPARATTIACSVQFAGACRASDLICKARTVRRTSDLVFTEAVATDDAGSVVAHGTQVYLFRPIKGGSFRNLPASK